MAYFLQGGGWGWARTTTITCGSRHVPIAPHPPPVARAPRYGSCVGAADATTGSTGTRYAGSAVLNNGFGLNTVWTQPQTMIPDASLRNETACLFHAASQHTFTLEEIESTASCVWKGYTPSTNHLRKLDYPKHSFIRKNCDHQIKRPLIITSFLV